MRVSPRVCGAAAAALAVQLLWGSSAAAIGPTNVLASVSSTGIEGNQDSGFDMSLDLSTATMSSDGRYVAFTSTATNLVPAAASGYGQVYVRDMVAGTTRLVSVSSTGQVGNGTSS